MTFKSLHVERAEHPELKAVVFRLTGILTDVREAFAFLEDVRAELHGDTTAVIVHLGKVDHVTSAGIGILAAAHTTASRDARRVLLVSVPARSRPLFDLVGLTPMLPQFDSEEAALQAVRAG